MRLIIVVLPHILDSSLGVSLDIANTANRLARHAGGSALFEIVLATPQGGAPLTANGLQLQPLVALPSPRCDDLIVLPGFMAAHRAAVCASLETKAVGDVQRWLIEAAAQGASIAAGCTGTFVLAGTRLLDGRAATTTWWLAPVFRQLFPAVRLDLDHLVVSSGRIITAGAALAQADLMLHLVRLFGAQRLARDCSRYLLFDARVSQGPYPVLAHLMRQDPFLERVEEWLSKHLAEGFKVEEMAAALHVSPRTLARRLQASVGMSVVQITQRMRIERATLLLETSDLPLTEVAAQVGYAEAATLRRLLHSKLGVGPGAIRARVRHVA